MSLTGAISSSSLLLDGGNFVIKWLKYYVKRDGFLKHCPSRGSSRWGSRWCFKGDVAKEIKESEMCCTAVQVGRDKVQVRQCCKASVGKYEIIWTCMLCQILLWFFTACICWAHPSRSLQNLDKYERRPLNGSLSHIRYQFLKMCWKYQKSSYLCMPLSNLYSVLFFYCC